MSENSDLDGRGGGIERHLLPHCLPRSDARWMAGRLFAQHHMYSSSPVGQSRSASSRLSPDSAETPETVRPSDRVACSETKQALERHRET